MGLDGRLDGVYDPAQSLMKRGEGKAKYNQKKKKNKGETRHLFRFVSFQNKAHDEKYRTEKSEELSAFALARVESVCCCAQSSESLY